MRMKQTNAKSTTIQTRLGVKKKQKKTRIINRKSAISLVVFFFFQKLYRTYRLNYLYSYTIYDNDEYFRGLINKDFKEKMIEMILLTLEEIFLFKQV